MRHLLTPKERARTRPSNLGSLLTLATVVIFGCLLSLTPRTALAQASAGVTGTVTDPSGAVITDAHVTISNEDTSVSSKTV